MMPVEVLTRIESLELELGLQRAENERLRAENRRLQAENRALRADVVMLRAENAELRQLLTETRQALTAQGVQMAELERRLNQSSLNSSKPPSSDGPDVERPPRGKGKKGKRKRGGQAGHVGKGRELLPEDQVSRFVDHYPSACAACGCLLMGADPAPERIQTIDIPPIAPIVEEHRIHSLSCLACGHVTKAEVPPDLRASPFGPRLHAVVALMSGLLRLAKREIRAALDILYSVRVGVGSIPKMERRMKTALDAPYDSVLQGIRGSPMVHQDTTGWRENKQRAQLWITATLQLAHYHINPRANRKVARALLGEDYDGVVVTDRTAVQAWSKQQWCWSHVGRDFAELAELKGGAWYGGRLQACARRVHAQWAERAAGKITHAEMVERLAPVREQVHRLLVNAADHAPSKRASRVCAGLLKGEDKLWIFLEHEGVSPTNNHAERCARKAVLWRAVSFGSDSAIGSRYAERILTIVNTLRLQNRDRELLDWLVAARVAQLNGQPGPNLLPVPSTP